MSNTKEEVLSVIKELVNEGVLYINTEVFTNHIGYGSFGNSSDSIESLEIVSTLEVRDTNE